MMRTLNAVKTIFSFSTGNQAALRKVSTAIPSTGQSSSERMVKTQAIKTLATSDPLTLEDLEAYSVDTRASTFAYTLDKVRTQLSEADVKSLSKKTLDHGQPAIFNALAVAFPDLVNSQAVKEQLEAKKSTSSEFVHDLMLLNKQEKLAPSLHGLFAKQYTKTNASVRIVDADDAASMRTLKQLAKRSTDMLAVCLKDGKHDGEVQVYDRQQLLK